MNAYKKNFDDPDEVRKFEKGKVDIAQVGGVTFGRVTFEPGWKWSLCIKPIAKTKSCEVMHAGYILSGKIHYVMDDGSSIELGKGDAFSIQPGHDAWVIGNEPCVTIDFTGMEDFAKK